MQFLSYGEDSLTLWALTRRLDYVLQQLGDISSPESALIMYRPSFGRRAAHKSGGRRSEFGEFDSIVATPAAVYLVEAKWSGSSALHKEVVILRREQIRRHRVLRFYLERWRQGSFTDWSRFTARHNRELEAEFEGLTMPPQGSALARNLEFVLTRLALCGSPVQDVLLFSTVGTSSAPKKVNPDSFRIVVCKADSLGGAGYIDLNA